MSVHLSFIAIFCYSYAFAQPALSNAACHAMDFTTKEVYNLSWLLLIETLMLSCALSDYFSKVKKNLNSMQKF